MKLEEFKQLLAQPIFGVEDYKMVIKTAQELKLVEQLQTEVTKQYPLLCDVASKNLVF